MCLYISQRTKLLIAGEDIPCYVVARMYEDGTPLSFYKRCKITPRMKSKIVRQGNLIEEALHSFKLKKDAERFMREKQKFNFDPLQVLSCYIPKGAKYYKGYFEWGISFWDAFTVLSYASNKRNLVIKK
jgi:hypothetical protein